MAAEVPVRRQGVEGRPLVRVFHLFGLFTSDSKDACASSRNYFCMFSVQNERMFAVQGRTCRRTLTWRVTFQSTAGDSFLVFFCAFSGPLLGRLRLGIPRRQGRKVAPQRNVHCFATVRSVDSFGSRETRDVWLRAVFFSHMSLGKRAAQLTAQLASHLAHLRNCYLYT